MPFPLIKYWTFFESEYPTSSIGCGKISTNFLLLPNLLPKSLSSRLQVLAIKQGYCSIPFISLSKLVNPIVIFFKKNVFDKFVKKDKVANNLSLLTTCIIFFIARAITAHTGSYHAE